MNNSPADLVGPVKLVSVRMGRVFALAGRSEPNLRLLPGGTRYTAPTAVSVGHIITRVVSGATTARMRAGRDRDSPRNNERVGRRRSLLVSGSGEHLQVPGVTRLKFSRRRRAATSPSIWGLRIKVDIARQEWGKQAGHRRVEQGRVNRCPAASTTGWRMHQFR